MFYGDQCVLYVRKLLQALVNEEIPVIVMKGWAFITTLYGGDHSQRICEDIDILVRPQDIDAVEVILDELEFDMAPESWDGYNRRYYNGARYFAPISEEMPGAHFSVGLHWGLWHIPSFDVDLVDVDALFERARSLMVAGEHALRLSVEDELVYMAAHTILHHFFEDSIFRYYEFAAVIREVGGDVEWEKVLDRTKGWDVVLTFEEMAKRVDDLWIGIVPKDVFSRSNKMKPSFLEHFTLLWIKTIRARSTFMHLLYWITFPVWWQRGIIAFQDIFPSPRYLAYRYGKAPRGIWVLLYFRRFWHALNLLFR